MHAEGPLSGEALVAENRRFFDEEMEAFRACRTWLSNYGPADLSGVKAEHLRELAEISLDVAKQNPDLLVAIVAPADLTFGLSRMWESLADEAHWRTQVFREEDEARAWLVRETSGETTPDGSPAGER